MHLKILSCDSNHAHWMPQFKVIFAYFPNSYYSERKKPHQREPLTPHHPQSLFRDIDFGYQTHSLIMLAYIGNYLKHGHENRAIYSVY